MSLLECLVVVSEKAANIARKIRQEEHLFGLLVEEKKSDEANPRFVQDFKTLADVLIQQTVKHDVGKIFPEINDYIKGEESNIFCNKLGETICVQVLNTKEETSNLLEKVLDGDKRAADLLSDEVHRNIKIEDVNTELPVPWDFSVDLSKLGIWIDPIDSTAEYISGVETFENYGIHATGLNCVTVLIGVFERKSGNPLMGVVNQPFFIYEDYQWTGRCYWGINLPNYTKSSLTLSLISPPKEFSDTGVVCLSSSENEDIKRRLREHGYQLVEAAGAGYKLLSVITGNACAYILTKSSTFKWDTCGPQAILRSLGGDILVQSSSNLGNFVTLKYLEQDGLIKIEKYCNEGGLIAYRNKEVAEDILRIIHT